jgi:hypothetical protein
MMILIYLMGVRTKVCTVKVCSGGVQCKWWCAVSKNAHCTLPSGSVQCKFGVVYTAHQCAV